jgi:hypothetical protein
MKITINKFKLWAESHDWLLLEEIDETEKECGVLIFITPSGGKEMFFDFQDGFYQSPEDE